MSNPYKVDGKKKKKIMDDDHPTVVQQPSTTNASLAALIAISLVTST
jgi:hypothetical protein